MIQKAYEVMKDEANSPQPQFASRDLCHGVLPLAGRIPQWMHRTCAGDELHSWVEEFGSPLNVINPEVLKENIRDLTAATESRGVDCQVFFARKANKCLAFVDAANDIGAGVDTASEHELLQVLDRGVPSERIVCTAAVKTEDLMRLCLEANVTMVIDNLDELRVVNALAAERQVDADVALRISGFMHYATLLRSRFGFNFEDVVTQVVNTLPAAEQGRLNIGGVHFHLEGYCPGHRISAIRQSMGVIEGLRRCGYRPRFLDIGGGIPVSYLQSDLEWTQFWSEHRRALLGLRKPITYRNHTLGYTVYDGRLLGAPHCYPFYNHLTRDKWLSHILDAKVNGSTIASMLRDRRLELRCEPGRSVLDGCGMTVARVEYRKQTYDGEWLIGLSMNGHQCRTSSDDFLVDPLLVRGRDAWGDDSLCADSVDGFLVGNYCMETDLLMLRKLRFPSGVRRGDLVVFPNTAGYFMHFKESPSHQHPLAQNVIVDLDGGPPRLDPIDNG